MELARITAIHELPRIEEAIDRFRHQLLQVALDVCHGNRCRAADALGIHRNTLSRLCEQHGIAKAYGRKKAKRR